MLEFEQVGLQFAGSARPVLQGCSFTVHPGELVVLLGPSGCGKTSLLKLVNRLYEPTEGRIYLHGQDIRQVAATQLRRQIGYVIQQSGLFPHMTVAENIGVVPKLLGWSRPQIQARIDELLLLMELPPREFRDRHPHTLSGGQQQRVGVARALAGNPDLLLMDEPFGAVDEIARRTLQAALVNLQRQLHKTILFVSHDIEEALQLGDRILILKDGQIVQYDTPLQVLTQPANPFVQTLVGGSDGLRHLGLITVADLVTDHPSPKDWTVDSHQSDYQVIESPMIAPEATLRQALALMLQTQTTELAVGAAGNPIGRITFQQLQRAAAILTQGE